MSERKPPIDSERYKAELRDNPRRLHSKGGVVRTPTKVLPSSNRGRERGGQPRLYARHGDTEIMYRRDLPKPHDFTAKSKKGIPGVCKYEVVYKDGVKKFGVYYGNRQTPQLFNTKEKAMRFQAECKKSHGLKGLGKMAKKKAAKKATKKSKKSVASRKARGSHCVFTPKGKLFNCYAQKTSASAVVKGMNKRSPGWAVKSSGR